MQCRGTENTEHTEYTENTEYKQHGLAKQVVLPVEGLQCIVGAHAGLAGKNFGLKLNQQLDRSLF